MSYCLNPDCPKPQNRSGRDTCRACGSRLLLKERYRSLRLIGQGGFGRTFLAVDEDKPSKPHCVIKQFLPVIQEARHVRKAADLFEREAIQLESLGHHPQIPALLAHFSQDGRQYLVQEFIEGKTLIELVSSKGAFSEAQVREVLSSLLPVLEFIHAHRVIHRDIKPNNIIVPTGNHLLGQAPSTIAFDWVGLTQLLAQEATQGFRDGVGGPYRLSEAIARILAKVPQDWMLGDRQRCQHLAEYFTTYGNLGFSQRQYLIADASRLVHELRQKYEMNGHGATSEHLVLVDFGAVKEANQTALELTGTAIGSPEYLAPEQSRGKATFASDLYSLGVTCLYLLTERSPSDLFDTHQGVWIWQSYLKQPMSESLIQILNKLTESSTSRRYVSASEVLLDLGQGSSSQPEPLQPTAIVETPRPTPPISRPSVPSVPNQLSFDVVISAPQRVVSALPATPKGSASRKKAEQSWRCFQTLVNTGRVYAIALSPTPPLLVSSSGATLRLWNWQTGQALRNLSGHLDLVLALAIAPSGKLLISGSADKTIKFWELPTGKRLASLTLHTDTVLALSLNADGSLLASSSLHDPLMLLNVTTGQEHGKLHGHSSRVDAIAFSPDKQVLSSGDGDGVLKFWDVQQLQPIRTLQAHSQTITTIAYSPDGKTLASGSADGTVKLWSTQTGRAKRTLDLQQRVNGIACKTLAIASDTLQLWNPRNGECQVTLDKATPPVTGVCYGIGLPHTTILNARTRSRPEPNEVIASVGSDRAIYLWQLGYN